MQYSVKLLVAALLALSPVAHPALREFALAQVTTQVFELPATVPSGTTLSIQSSPNLGVAAQALKREFEAAYDGTDVGVDITSSDQAIAALVDNTIDLAAIGRPLTDAEQAEGLNTVALERAKIAIIVGPDNPFNGNLTFEQFAAMFRGEITDWSEVGGEPGPMRFVDRPEISDTRRSLSQYDVFRNAPFEPGATTDPVADDDTATVIQALGTDGISYAIAPHVLGQPGVKIVPMHQTLPDDPRYPYSQPRYFVYRGEPSPAVAAFLGYVTSPEGATALTAAQVAEVGAVTAGAVTTGAVDPVEPVPEADPGSDPVPADSDPVAQAPTDPAPVAETNEGGFAWWWLLLPLAALGGLAWLLGRGKGGMAPNPDTSVVTPATAAPPVPPPTAEHPVPPVAEPPVAPTPAAPPLVDEPVVAAVPEPPAPVMPELPVVSEPVVPAPVVPNPVVISPELEVIPEPEIIVVEEVSPAAEPIVEPPAPQPAVLPAVPIALGLTGLAAGAAASLASTEDQSAVEASKYNVIGRPAEGDIDLSTIDDGLPTLPDGYGESRIVLMPRDPQWAYAYWDTPHTHKEELRRQGGEHLALRLYDVTGINLGEQAPHNLQQFSCDEIAREWYMQIPVSDRDYQVEIGYLAGDGRWLVLARSNTIRIPPVYPSDWTEEHFLTVTWDENLRGKTILTLADPRFQTADSGLHEQIYALAKGGEALRVDGSLFGSMQHMAGSMAPPISSYLFASGAGREAAGALSLSGVSSFTLPGGPGFAPGEFSLPTMSGVSGFTLSGFPGLTMSGVGLSAVEMAALSQAQLGQLGLTMSGVGLSGVGLTASGLNVSGLTMSGIGMVAAQPRKFWLVADAELIVYGATEPDASVTVAGIPIELCEDGTFRFHQSFQDGTVDYPIMAIAVDGEQSRNVHLTFERRTPDCNTNTKDEAQDEWPIA